MRTKYKLGERILFNNENGLETLATITGIKTEITSSGTETYYVSNGYNIEESIIVGRIQVSKPRGTRKKKLKLSQQAFPLETA